MTWAIVDMKECEPPRRIFVANCHLDDENPRTRLRQAQILVEQMRVLNRDGLPVLLVGDFNALPSSPTRETIRSGLRDMVDPWTTLGKPEASTYHGFGEVRETRYRIDWVLASSALEVSSIVMGSRPRKEPTTGQWQYPSDHHPVTARVRTCGQAGDDDHRPPESP